MIIIIESTMNQLAKILPQINKGKINKGDRVPQPLNINYVLIHDILSLMNQNRVNSVIQLKDEYYHSFYDGQISLFILFLKVSLGYNKIYKNYSNIKDDFDIIWVSDDQDFLNENVDMNIYFDGQNDIFSKLSKHTKIYDSENELRNFILHANNQKNIGHTNIKSLFKNDNFLLNVMNLEDSSHLNKDKFSNWNNFYYVKDNEFKLQSFLNEQAKNNKKSILFFDLTDSNKNFYDLLINNQKIMNHIQYFFVLQTNVKTNHHKFKINSSLIDFCKKENHFLEFYISHIKTDQFMTILDKIFYDEMQNLDKFQLFKLKLLYKKIKKFIFSYEIGYIQKSHQTSIQKEINEYLEYIKDDLLKEQFLNSYHDILNQVNEKSFFEFIKEKIHQGQYKKIYIHYSPDHIYEKVRKDLFDYCQHECILEKNQQYSIEYFNKSAPLMSVEHDSLMIHLGIDKVSKYFINRIDSVVITDMFSLKYLSHKKGLNIKVNNQSMNLDSIKEEMLDRRKNILKDLKEEDFEYIKEKYILKNDDKNSEEYEKEYKKSGEDKIFIYHENKYYYMTMKEIFEYELSYILSPNVHNDEYIQSIFEEICQSLERVQREKIKAALEKCQNNQKITDKKNVENHLNSMNKKFNFSEDEKIYIGGNLNVWLKGNSLPRRRKTFMQLMEYIDYPDDIERAWNNIQKESSQNRKSGRENKRAIQKTMSEMMEDHDLNDNQEILKNIKNQRYTIKREINQEHGESNNE